MTTLTIRSPVPSRLFASSAELPNAEGLEARVALRITSVLNDGARHLPHDVAERLRFAREKAVARARVTALAANAVSAGGPRAQRNGTLAWLGGSQRGWWLRLAAVLPLVALVAGLVLIQDMHASSQISAAAEVDSELLADEVPPNAYADPGFVEFLKTPAN